MSFTANGTGMFTNGPVLITNSSFSGNSLVGVAVNLGPAQMSNCTFVGNGIGVAVEPASITGATVLSSMIFGNTGVGLQLGLNGAYGLNTLFNNGTNVTSGGAVSMGNNVCGSGTC